MKTAELLYSNKLSIECITKAVKKTNCLAPAGVKGSKSRPTTVTIPPKFSNIMKLLDEMLIYKSVNALESDTGIFCQIKTDGTVYSANCDGKGVDWVGSIPNTPLNLMPIFLWSIKKTNIAGVPNQNELREVFQSACEEWNTSSGVSVETAALLCDSFYYNFVYTKILEEVEQYSDSLALETIQQGYDSGLLSTMEILNKIDNKPNFDNLELGLRKKKSKKKKEGQSFKNCMDGGMILPVEWNENQKTRIPSLTTLADYVPENAFFSSLNKIHKRLSRVMTRMDAGKIGTDAIGNDYINMFVVGKPGTGKTTMAYALGAATGMPTYTISVSKHTEEDTFEGMNKVIDGKLQFVKTDFLEAYTNGGIIIIEEINLADPAVIMGTIGQAIEAPFILKENGYKMVRRHPMCVVIGTMNIGTYGSRGVNQALSSRFKQTYILDDPEKKQFINILEKQGYTKADCTYVYDAYSKINKYLKSSSVNREDICLNLSLRTCMGALQNFDDGDDMKTSLINSLVGKIYEVDPDLAKDIISEVIDNLPNY